jgi:hypothetical protein
VSAWQEFWFLVGYTLITLFLLFVVARQEIRADRRRRRERVLREARVVAYTRSECVVVFHRSELMALRGVLVAQAMDPHATQEYVDCSVDPPVTTTIGDLLRALDR